MIHLLKRLLRWSLVPAILVLLSAVSEGQQPPAPAPPPQTAPPPSVPPIERNAPALQYTFAGLAIMLIMVIVCMPSRKQ